MPRNPDPKLEARILDAARELLHQGGEDKLSMRVLARMAGTNTPALYRRFRDRDAILRALGEGFRRDLLAVLQPCKTPEEMAHAVLGYALKKPREYELYYSTLINKLPGDRPNFEFAKKRLADWLGGTAEERTGLVLALMALIHGTALLQTAGVVSPGNKKTMLAVFAATVHMLIRDAAALP